MPEENSTPNTASVSDAQNASNTPSTPAIEPASNTPATQTTPNVPTNPTPAAPAIDTPTLAPDDTPAPMSSPIMKSKVHKPKNKLLPVVIILTILTLASLGASIFAFIQVSDKDTEIARLRSELANQGITIPTTPDDNNDNNPSDNESSAITPAIRAEVLSAVPGGLVLSEAKNLNTSYSMLYSINSSFGSNDTSPLPAFRADLSLSTNLSSLTLNWDLIKAFYPNLNITKSGTEEFTDLGLSGKPTDLLLTGFGQAVGNEALFFLMDDGTVEYIPLAKAIQDNNIKSYGKLPNVSNVIKFYNVSSCPAESYTSCGHQSLAQRADGNYYELYDAVEITGNFNVQTH